MFRPYIMALRCFYDDNSEIDFERVKFYIDDAESWDALAQEKFPRSPHILEQIKGEYFGKSV